MKNSIVLMALFISFLAQAKQELPSFSFTEEKGLQIIKPSELKDEENKNKDSEAKKTDDSKKENPAKPDPETVTEQESLNLPENKISEDFAPEAQNNFTNSDFVTELLESSWFFEKKNTKRKIGLIPLLQHNTGQGTQLGLRLFTYSSDKKGYYMGLSGSKYLFQYFNNLSFLYIGDKNKKIKSESFFIYDNHYERNYGIGMNTFLSDKKKLYAHRAVLSYKLFYQQTETPFYFGIEPQVFFRKKREKYQKEQTDFDKTDFFAYLKTFAGYEGRDNWKDPREGLFYELSLGCKAVLDYDSFFCKAEADFRFYIPLFKNVSTSPFLKNTVLATRFFAGSSLFQQSPYSLVYSLGGSDSFQNIKALRGFVTNRFRGDKIYFAQSEFRLPLNKYIEAVLFTELGEVAEYGEEFQNFVIDYGGGLRFGFPPSYDMKLRIDYGTGLDLNDERNTNLSISFFQAF